MEKVQLKPKHILRMALTNGLLAIVAFLAYMIYSLNNPPVKFWLAALVFFFVILAIYFFNQRLMKNVRREHEKLTSTNR